LQSDEIRSNSDLIQFLAATIPWAEVAAPGLLTESVLRVAKADQLLIGLLARWGETSLMIWTITGRVPFGPD